MAGWRSKVLRQADHILTIGPGLKKLFLDKKIGIPENRISVITNGYDPEDFTPEQSERRPADFTITYTGSMSGNYEPGVFFSSIKAMINEKPHQAINLRLIGVFSSSIIEMINVYGLQSHVEIIPPVSHVEAIEKMKSSDALLLVIPRYRDDQLILTGKLFEYLAAGKPIICIGPKHGDAASVIEECQAGKTFERDQEIALKGYILDLIHNRGAERPQGQLDKAAQYSRESQTLNFIEVLKNETRTHG